MLGPDQDLPYKVMHWADPSIDLISCGENGWSEWDRIVLEALAPHIAWHNIHIYTGSDDYMSNVLAPHQADRAPRSCRALIHRVRHRQGIAHPIHVAYDEWNVWFRARASDTALEERYTLADALAVATYLNIFVRNCDTVRMANLAQLVNVIAPIFTSPDGIFVQTIYHPLRLYAEQFDTIALDAYVECDTYHFPPNQETSSWAHRVADLGSFQLLDVAATRDEARQALTLTVVNRDPERPITTTIELSDAAIADVVAIAEVNAGDALATNSFAQPPSVTVNEKRGDASGRVFSYDFPAHSLTVLSFRTEPNA
ncbi:MAG: alpha-L-arabinofuranosidase C-terminal domain-containing protein [Thermomicrobiales bacterium]